MEILLNEVTSASISDPIAAVRQLYVHFIEQVTSNPRQTKVFDIIFHRCEKTAEMQSFIQEREGRIECLSKVEAIFKSAVEQGILPINTDTWIAVQITHGYLIGLVHEWLVDPAAYDLRLHGESMVDVLLAGLMAKPPLLKV
jgi:TetR/AcrR family acrAB operon transcriptional repressor